MMVLLCLVVWLVCIGLACWVDLNAQKHINAGIDTAWNVKEGA